MYIITPLDSSFRGHAPPHPTPNAPSVVMEPVVYVITVCGFSAVEDHS